MKKVLLATAVASLLLAGCGKSGPTAVSAVAPAGVVEAQATATLLKGFRDIHMAVFTKLDADGNGRLDEYEASAAINLADFAKADKSKDHKLSKTEFMNYADGGGVFGFLRQSRTDFLNQARKALLTAFTKLDKNKDRVLQQSELNEAALKKVDVNLHIDALHVNVHITELDDAAFDSADKTQDTALSQAEFEDYCVDHFIKLINPKYTPGGGGDTPPTPADDPAPADDNSGN
ncbi:MAG: hypothetical protein JWM80_2832 [Cyanobacteria bacterium RYN_339]|nr:hypothetical protein [Cyanobacteria bacterium RYN_339]